MNTRIFRSLLAFVFLYALAFNSPRVHSAHFAENLNMETIINISLDSIFPSTFENNVNVPVIITGSNLNTVTQASLGGTDLFNLEIVSSSEIHALVPWDIEPGTYVLTVTDAGGSATLPTTVTISAEQPGWVSNGPYGGEVEVVSVDPRDPDHIFISVPRSGLYKTHDGGVHWEYSFTAFFPTGVQFLYPLVGQAPTLFVSGDNGLGLLRSTDDGETWIQIDTVEGYNPYTYPFTNVFVSPNQLGVVYATVGINNPEDPCNEICGLYKSIDQGDHWIQLTGTSGLRVMTLAFDPEPPFMNMIVGTFDGKILKTTDGGANWGPPLQVANQIAKLYYSPTLYNGFRSLWALQCGKRVYCTMETNDQLIYRSRDGGSTWQTITPPDGGSEGLAFHDTLPGVIWKAGGRLSWTTDDGDTWRTTQDDPAKVIQSVNDIVVLPGSQGTPTTRLLAGNKLGFLISEDGGVNWTESNEGIGALLPSPTASPFNGDEAYASARTGIGMLHTYDGGRSWQFLPASCGDNAGAVAFDPFHNGKAYFGDPLYSEGAIRRVRITTDHGQTCMDSFITIPSEYSERAAVASSITPDPEIENRILIGLTLDNDISGSILPGPGLIYASEDGGLTWTQQSTPANLKRVGLIVFDPHDHNILYAASFGTGLLRSSDRGSTWSLLDHQPIGNGTISFAIDPRNSNNIFVFSYGDERSNTTGGTSVTHDGGDSWTEIDLGGGFIDKLQFVLVGDEYWLYCATTNGLKILKAGHNFDGSSEELEPGPGISSVAPSEGFDATVETGRIVYYIGTTGGTRPYASIQGVQTNTTAASLFAGGIYRFVTRATDIQTPDWVLQGNTTNAGSVMALESFNGKLYAGTANWVSGNGQVWRMDEDKWLPVSMAGMEQACDGKNPAISDLEVFKGKLYASMTWGTCGNQIWRTDNGTEWTKVADSPAHIPAWLLRVFNNELYTIGASPTIEIWRSSSGDPGSWENLVDDSFGDPNNDYSWSATIYNGALYVGTNNPITGSQVWRSFNGEQWEPVNQDGFGDANNFAVYSMVSWRGTLLAGTLNKNAGGQIWKYEGTSWSRVLSNGFEYENNSSITALYVNQFHLFAVADNTYDDDPNTGLQIWTTTDASHWTALNLDGFGDAHNRFWEPNAVTSFDDYFYIGTQNSFGSSEIWKYTIRDNVISIFLPLIQR
jgi:photosystem II stability/assembly factor-like uncharacterized protein